MQGSFFREGSSFSHRIFTSRVAPPHPARHSPFHDHRHAPRKKRLTASKRRRSRSCGLSPLHAELCRWALSPVGSGFLFRGSFLRRLHFLPPSLLFACAQCGFSSSHTATLRHLSSRTTTVFSAPQVLIWRAYRLHGVALKDMKRKLREWESFLSNEQDKTAKLGMA